METEKINWIDVLEIAIQLNEKFPEIDPQSVSYTHLTLPTTPYV